MKFDNLVQRLHLGLREDSASSDVTTRQLPGRKERVHAFVLAKEEGVFCGAFLLKPLFASLDKRAQCSAVPDGTAVKKGQKIASVHATLESIFQGERLFLNLACHLSGIATLTRRFVRAVRGTRAKIYDTRKTTPLWRDLEKFAVVCGGGHNHRFSLGDAILVKDNHFRFLEQRGVKPSDVYRTPALRPKEKKRVKFKAMEAQSYRDIWEGIKARADIILLDNMSPEKLRNSVELVRAARRGLGSDKPEIEVTGGVSLVNVRRIAKLGVDRISVGALTHSNRTLDLSLEVK